MSMSIEGKARSIDRHQRNAHARAKMKFAQKSPRLRRRHFFAPWAWEHILRKNTRMRDPVLSSRWPFLRLYSQIYFTFFTKGANDILNFMKKCTNGCNSNSNHNHNGLLYCIPIC